MVLVQNWQFLDPFYSSNMGQGNVFYVILEGKIVFLGYKNKHFKQSKI